MFVLVLLQSISYSGIEGSLFVANDKLAALTDMGGCDAPNEPKAAGLGQLLPCVDGRASSSPWPSESSPGVHGGLKATTSFFGVWNPATSSTPQTLFL